MSMKPAEKAGGSGNILVVDDDRAMRELIRDILESTGHAVNTVSTAEQALAAMSTDSYGLLITDVRLPGMDGRTLLGRVRERWPGLPVVIVTAYGSIPDAVEAIKLGAVDYLTKPLPSPDALRALVDRVLTDTAAGAAGGDLPEGIIAEDPAFRRVIDLARAVAPKQTTVLITGESGTGKEVIAGLIHDLSPRKKMPFITLNCAALVRELLPAELFGHERGAFTGAHKSRTGRFEEASGGTLFLDEIAEMDTQLQAKLLRALQERVIEKVGGSRPIKVDVRVIAATNRNLEEEVDQGRFRDDLYYRLRVFPIHIPPLRDRPGDILPMAKHFIKLHAERESESLRVLGDEAAGVLSAHSWPGNVRELANVMERAAILAGEGKIEVEHLDLSGKTSSEVPNKSTLRDMERQAIIEALAMEGGNRRQAAKRLGIALRTLQYKINSYNLKGRV